MKKTVLKIIAALLAAGSVQADTITQTNTFSGTPNYTSTLTFNKFDTDGGRLTLTGVNVSIFLLTEAQGSVGIDNDGASAASGTVTMGSKLTVTTANPDVGPTLLSSTYKTLSPISATTSKTMSLSADDGDGVTYSTSGSDYDIMNIVESQKSGSLIIGNAFWSEYTANGSETFDFIATVDQSMNLTAFGGSQQLINPMAARGNVVVTYNFIPEPATASMSVMVLLAAVWVRRRFID